MYICLSGFVCLSDGLCVLTWNSECLCPENGSVCWSPCVCVCVSCLCAALRVRQMSICVSQGQSFLVVSPCVVRITVSLACLYEWRGLSG